MPKRVAVGTSLGLFSRSAGRKTSAALKKAARAIRSASIESLEDRLLMSRSWFVAPWGNNNNPGTTGQPLQSIQAAANNAQWGDYVEIEAGTYHETVTPPHSGVTFEAYQGQSVTITGADNIGGFSQYSGNIWRAWDGINLGNGNNQIFVDGKQMIEARYPNTQDLSWQNQATTSGAGGSTLYSSALNQGNGYWNGATIHITPGQGWVSYSGTVNNSGPGWINVSLPGLGGFESPVSGNHFYLTGKYQMLDSPGEWYRDNSGWLYVWMPNSDNPNWHTVQAKARNYAFDLSNVSNTTLYNLNIFGATIHTGWSSANTMLNHLSVNYPTQVGWISNGWSVPGPQGVELYGNNSTLQNSNISNSAGDGAYIAGNNVLVQNNLIHDVDTAGIDAAGIRIHGWGDVIDHNTVYNAGRDGINIQTPATVTNNVVHDAMLQTTDGAGIYTVSLNGQGSQIAGNYVYNVNSGGFGAAGIFLDNDSSNWNIHDNTTSNVQWGLKLNYSSTNENVHNNSFYGSISAVAGNNSPGQPYNWSGSQFYNNVYYGSTYMGYGYSQWSNSTRSGSPGAPSTPAPPSVQPSPPPPPTPTPTPSSSGVSATSTISATNYAGIYIASSPYGCVGYTSNGAWVKYSNVNFGSGVSSFSANIALPNANAGQKIVLRLDSATGPIIGTLTTNGTGGWSNFQTQSTSVSGASGTHDLYLTFSGWGAVANVLSFSFGQGGSSGVSARNAINAAKYSNVYLASSPYGVLGYTANGAWAEYDNIDFGSGVSSFQANVALPYANAGQKIVIRVDSSNGQTIGTLTTNGTGGWSNYTVQSTGVSNVTGVHKLFLTFAGWSGIANVAWFKFA